MIPGSNQTLTQERLTWEKRLAVHADTLKAANRRVEDGHDQKHASDAEPPSARPRGVATASVVQRGDQRRAAASSASAPQATAAAPDSSLIDQLLGRLADLVVDRLMARSETQIEQPPDEWMDARAAAIYLGVHRDTLRELAAGRAVPVHQDGPGCKLYFRRDELDDWRRSGRTPRSQLRAVA